MLAELEIFHSRPIAPTRRIALGSRTLPVGSGHGAGPLLLGAVVARHIRDVGPDDRTDLTRLTHQVERGYRIAQPRLRHRFQEDRVGLIRSRHRVGAERGELRFDHDDANGLPVQQVLGSIYAAADLGPGDRRSVLGLVRRAMRWIGEPGDTARLLAYLTGGSNGFALPVAAARDPVAWALETLGFVDRGRALEPPEREDVVKRFRRLLRDAHPDQGGESDAAAARIAELAEARRILLR